MGEVPSFSWRKLLWFLVVNPAIAFLQYCIETRTRFMEYRRERNEAVHDCEQVPPEVEIRQEEHHEAVQDFEEVVDFIRIDSNASLTTTSSNEDL